MSGIPAGAGSLLGKRLGKYEILALLALGGTAEIYLARIGGTNGFEKYVVVKCLHDHLADDTDFVKMFLDEARISAVLDHSNIVQTFELGEHESRYYMVMEFLAGLSLAMVVRRAAERVPGGKIPTALILNIAAQAAAGLHYAHEKQSGGKPLNMVHRDISPQNLVISFEGVVKVVDFGIARAELRETKTKAGTIKGKFAYMSPEQCVATNVDRRTDVFALGVIVHELLTGRRLFKRNSPYETYQAVIECAVSPPSAVNHELDPALDEIIMKAVAKEKENRFATAEAFGDAMQGYLHHRGKGSGPGEIAKFFDEHFAQEITEHGERMSELMSGRDLSIDTGTGWGDDDEEAKKRASETVDLGKGRQEEDSEISLSSNDVEVVRHSEVSLDRLVSRLSTENEARGGDDDGPAPEKTRIEANPLDKIRELEEHAGRTPIPQGSVTGGPAPLPAPPTGPNKQIVNARASGKFPDLAQIPTVIAEEDPSVKPARPGQPNPSELAPTAAAQPIDPNHGAVPRVGAYSATQDAIRQSQVQAAMQQMDAARGPTEMMPSQQPPPSGQPPGPPANHGPGGPYPVMPGGRPFSSDLAPSDMSRPSQRSFDPQQAASMMSPVGQQYPQTDWAAAASRNAKALAPWQLAALFVGALGAALLVTILIAKMIHG